MMGRPAAEDAASAHTGLPVLADQNRVFRPDPESPANFLFTNHTAFTYLTRSRIALQAYEPESWRKTRTLRNRRPAWRRRHGRGLQGPRHAPGAHSRHKGVAGEGVG